MNLDARLFYETTEKHLERLAKAHGVQDLLRYYKMTDFHDGSCLNELTGINQVFAQIAFHAQNATLISSIVKFEMNFGFLKDVLCDFDPRRLLEKYHGEEKVSKLINDLRYNDSTGKGLRWNSSKSKAEKKDSIITRYANALLDAAEYLKTFTSKREVLDDLIKHYKNADYKAIIRYFRGKIKHGFSVALTCDFLKEFDEAFSDLPKPDVHIKDTLCALYGYDDGYYTSENRQFKCIADMRGLVSDINKSLPQNEQITVYQLDRMIWLVCSGRFFLDNVKNAKETYLDDLQELRAE